MCFFMDQVIQVLWASAHMEEARQVSRCLIEKKLVACAQISSGMESIYMWNESVTTSLEVKVCLKTVERHFSEIEEFILENSSYDIPEILKINVSGLEKYLKWVVDSVR